jgi:hypothetical protein
MDHVVTGGGSGVQTFATRSGASSVPQNACLSPSSHQSQRWQAVPFILRKVRLGQGWYQHHWAIQLHE